MDDNQYQNLKTNVFMSIITVLMLSTLYLFYQNQMAEDMIRELNRDYELLVKEHSRTVPEPEGT